MKRHKVAWLIPLMIGFILFQWSGFLFLEPVFGSPDRDQNGWTISEIDTRYIGAFPSMVIDSDQRIHVAYYSIDSWQDKKPMGRLKYATLMDGRWNITTVDEKPQVDLGRYAAAAIDSKDGVHLGYFDATAGLLKYAHRSANQAWDIQVIEKTGMKSRGVSLALDSAGNPHLAFHSQGSLRYATKMGRSWRSETIGVVGDVLESPSLVVDRSDKIHIVFYDKTTGRVRYITNATGGWKDSVIDSVGEATPAPLITLGPDGTVHVIFYDTNQKVLKYASRVANQWVVKTITEVGDVSFDLERLDYTPLEGSPVKPAITVDRHGQVHYSFFDGRRQALGYATLKNGAWKVDLVEHTPDKDVGRYSSILVDGHHIHIAYRDASSNVLKYAVHSIDPGS